MASGDSDYLENKMLDHELGGPDYVRPATVYVGLFTAAPGDAGGGTEVNGNAYARVAVTNNATNFPAAAAGAKSNGVALNFPTPTPAGWGLIVAVGIFDAASAGNLLKWGDLAANKNVNAGDPVSFPVGELDFTRD